MDTVKLNEIKELTESIDQIRDHNADKLAKGINLGSIDFTKYKSVFHEAIEFANELSALNFEYLPLPKIKEMKPLLLNLAKSILRVSSFQLEGTDNPSHSRDALGNTVKTSFDSALLNSYPNIAYLSVKSAHIQESMKKSSQLLEKLEKETSSTLNGLEEKKTEIDKIVQAAKDATSKIGVAQFALMFEELKTAHLTSSKHWLITSIILGIVTVGLAVVLLVTLPISGSISDGLIIQKLMAKAVILSFLYYAVLWSARNYKAHKHLEVSNEHKQAALNTFETFVTAAGDEHTKNAVLLEATHSIFSQTQTGYLNKQEDNSSSRIVEVLKTFNKAE